MTCCRFREHVMYEDVESLLQVLSLVTALLFGFALQAWAGIPRSELDLADNADLFGSLPSQLGGLTAVEYLYVHGTHVNTSVPETFRRQTRRRVLCLPLPTSLRLPGEPPGAQCW